MFACHEWKGPPALLNQRVCRLQNFSAKLSSRFLFYGINSHLKDIENVTGFTTVKHLSSKQILDIDFLVPPLPEQRRIVAELDDLYASIAESIGAKQAIIADLKAYKQSLIYEAVTGKREV